MLSTVISLLSDMMISLGKKQATRHHKLETNHLHRKAEVQRTALYRLKRNKGHIQWTVVTNASSYF